MKLTWELLHSAGTSGVGFNFQQLHLLGVPWPPKKGWLVDLVGTDISEEVWATVVDLKGKSHNGRKKVLKARGYVWRRGRPGYYEQQELCPNQNPNHANAAVVLQSAYVKPCSASVCPARD